MKKGFTYTREDLASTQIRAVQIADALHVHHFKYSLEIAKDFSVLIYVKFPGPKEEMDFLNKKGVIQILDPLDNYNFKGMMKRKSYLTSFIAASLTHKIYLEKTFDITTVYIPHHHVNFRKKMIAIKKPNNLTPGYIGDIRYWKQNQFLEKHFHSIKKVFNYQNLEDSYLNTDIGFFYRKEDNKISFNSNIKLLNFMSFGIPSVFSPELSYLEVANHGEHCLFSGKKGEFLNSMKYLMNNYELRKRMNQKAFMKAKDYHITKIIEQYSMFLNSLSSKYLVLQ